MKRINYINKIGAPSSLVVRIKGKKSKVIAIQLLDEENEADMIRNIERFAVESIEEPEKIEVEPNTK